MLVDVSATLGFLAPWYPSFEMINHFRPFAVGALEGLLGVFVVTARDGSRACISRAF